MTDTRTQANVCTLRPGTPEDAEQCGRIAYEAFGTITKAHGFPHYYPSEDVAIKMMQMSFSRTEHYSVIAEQDGRIVGSNFLRPAGHVGGVGPITVLPSVQNGNVGRKLMEDVISKAKALGLSSVRLVQTAYHTRSLALYTKLGFDVMEPLALIQGPPIDISIPSFAVRSATMDDIAACDELHCRLHGYARGDELKMFIAQRMSTVVEHDGRITGYASMIGFSGHAIGESNEDLKALIGAATSISGPGFLLPIRNGDLFRWCINHGLKVVEPATLMSTGLYKQPAGVFLPSILF